DQDMLKTRSKQRDQRKRGTTSLPRSPSQARGLPAPPDLSRLKGVDQRPPHYFDQHRGGAAKISRRSSHRHRDEIESPLLMPYVLDTNHCFRLEVENWLS